VYSNRYPFGVATLSNALRISKNPFKMIIYIDFIIFTTKKNTMAIEKMMNFE